MAAVACTSKGVPYWSLGAERSHGSMCYEQGGTGGGDLPWGHEPKVVDVARLATDKSWHAWSDRVEGITTPHGPKQVHLYGGPPERPDQG